MRPIASGLNRIARTSFLLGALSWLGPLVLYILTMRHSVDYWDTGEMQTVPWILGISHPTGFPTFVLGGFIFSHLVTIGSVAFRMTLFSGVAMSFAAYMIFVAARELRVGATIACTSACLFACTNLAWSRGTRTEVHALAIAAGAALLTLALRYVRTRNPHMLPWIALTAAIGVGVHPVILFAILPTAVIVTVELVRVARQDARWALNAQGWRIFWQCTAGVLVAPLLYLYLPLRSLMVSIQHKDPTLALGVAAGRPYWDYDHPSVWSGFLREVSGSDFTVGGGLSALLHPTSYANIMPLFLVPNMAELGFAIMALGFLGIATLPRRTPPIAALGLVIGAIFAIVFASSYTSESDVTRYFLLALWIFFVCVALGMQALVDFVVGLLALRKPANTGDLMLQQHRVKTVAECFGAGLIGVCVVLLAMKNAPQFTGQPQDHGAEPFIARVLASTPDNAIIIATWVYATPLAYAAYVDQRMGHRILETSWPGDDIALIPEWLKNRPVIIVGSAAALPARMYTVLPLDLGTPQLLRVEKVVPAK